MRFQSLEIRNFRAITYLKLSDLGDLVLIAGPNGCGKSTIFDAIRFLKSMFGGYQPNEVHSWFSEFQINFTNDPQSLLKLANDRTKPIAIRGEIVLTKDERKWIEANGERLISELVWRTLVPEIAGWQIVETAALATRYREHQAEVVKRTTELLPVLKSELAQKTHRAEAEIQPSGVAEFQNSLLLEIVFSKYLPEHIGVVDYHGAQRTYAREQIGGVSLNLESAEQQSSQHALYNYANKYQNVKTQLAASYVRELIAAKAEAKSDANVDLNDTLKELFTIFFPGKTFLGTQPTTDGTLLFNIKTQSGAVHDINELSSGEKEILYGYLRLRNSNLKNSVLLIDEPELHLNPKLTNGLADFYHKHIGKALGNQLWLVTHSDALLRQVVGNPNYKVFHMQVAGTIPATQNQLQEITISEEIENVVIDLVGDLAAYRPGKRVVLLEGAGDSEFDETMITKLFPNFASEVNLISSGDKQKVRALHEVLERAKASGKLPFEFFSIVDRDTDDLTVESVSNRYKWDRYHIENYLLEPKFLLKVIRGLNLEKSDSLTEAGILNALKRAARKTLPSLVRGQLESLANQKLVNCIKTATNRSVSEVASSLEKTILSSKERIENTVLSQLNLTELKKQEKTFKAKLNQDLQSTKWLRTFAGREILTRFVHDTVNGRIGYVSFRNLVIAAMQEENFKPKGIKLVLDKIQAT